CTVFVVVFPTGLNRFDVW
nr:immunoglobulin heavy chain junction region [Macaca mulatta]MOX06983.1 immunoglobulin heavy chain junction region [Macaca mulatta]